jgi:hypothetical protein
MRNYKKTRIKIELFSHFLTKPVTHGNVWAFLDIKTVLSRKRPAELSEIQTCFKDQPPNSHFEEKAGRIV